MPLKWSLLTEKEKIAWIRENHPYPKKSAGEEFISTAILKMICDVEDNQCH